MKNNRDYARSDRLFNMCCEAAGIMSNKRQASKFRMKTGRAYSQLSEVKRAIKKNRKVGKS